MVIVSKRSETDLHGGGALFFLLYYGFDSCYGKQWRVVMAARTDPAQLASEGDYYTTV